DLDAGDGELGLREAPAVRGLGLERVDDLAARGRLARVAVAPAATATAAVVVAAARAEHECAHDQRGERESTVSSGMPRPQLTLHFCPPCMSFAVASGPGAPEPRVRPPMLPLAHDHSPPVTVITRWAHSSVARRGVNEPSAQRQP